MFEGICSRFLGLRRLARNNALPVVSGDEDPWKAENQAQNQALPTCDGAEESDQANTYGQRGYGAKGTFHAVLLEEMTSF